MTDTTDPGMLALIDALTSSPNEDVELLGYLLDESEITTLDGIRALLEIPDLVRETHRVEYPDTLHDVELSDAVYVDGKRLTVQQDVSIDYHSTYALVTVSIFAQGVKLGTKIDDPARITIVRHPDA